MLCGYCASNCFAARPSFEHLTVTVENISYQGSNSYRVDLTVYNRSNKTIVLKENNETFYVQTDILGQWKELNASHNGGDKNSVLLPQKEQQLAYILNIPLDIKPTIYRNSEGDINMMFKYLIRFVSGSDTSLRSISGESSYWITPKTDAWILREGM